LLFYKFFALVLVSMSIF